MTEDTVMIRAIRLKGVRNKSSRSGRQVLTEKGEDDQDEETPEEREERENFPDDDEEDDGTSPIPITTRRIRRF